MNKLGAIILCCIVVVSSDIALAQNPPAAPPAAGAAGCAAQPQIDCSWLTVDTTAKIATFQLISGLTSLNGGLNFNGFNEGKLTLTVPANWTVVIRFTNKDANLPHSAEVVDTTKPMPAGPVDPPAFARAMSVRLMQGLAAGESDSLKFVANKPGSYMIFCAVPGHGLAGMWIRFKVSATDKRPTLAASTT
ncbi:MAG TPA: sulfocyanin-like copper-binding protein [Gemmatimonadales bacterium]|nr:sulfocyanin-like copper-binding protein [Gemmatimonadales bacterium]